MTEEALKRTKRHMEALRLVLNLNDCILKLKARLDDFPCSGYCDDATFADYENLHFGLMRLLEPVKAPITRPASAESIV